MKKENAKKKKKGFTLIELIVVIAILGVLAAIAVPRLGNLTGDAKVSADKANEKIILNTVTTLIAKDEIKLTKADGTAIETIKAILIKDTIDDTAIKIIDALNGDVPIPKNAEKKNFAVTIESSGKVSVSVVDEPAPPAGK